MAKDTDATQERGGKKTAWIIEVCAVVVSIVAACIAVFTFNLPGKQLDQAFAAENESKTMQVIRNYDKFMMQYVDYTVKLSSQNGLGADELEGYQQWRDGFDDIMEQMASVSDDDMTPEEKAYLEDVIKRYNERMQEATGSDLYTIPLTKEEAEQQEENRRKAAEQAEKEQKEKDNYVEENFDKLNGSDATEDSATDSK